MSMEASFPSMGATLFFGLTFVALITQGAPEVEFANPAETMAEADFQAPPEEADLIRATAWSEPLLSRDVALDEAAPERFVVAPAEGDAVQTVLQSPEIAPPLSEFAAALPGPDGFEAVPQDRQAGPGPANFPSPDLTAPAEAEQAARVLTAPRRPATSATEGPIADPAAPQVALARQAPPSAPARADAPALGEAQPLETVPAAARATIEATVTGDRVFLRVAPDISAEPIDQFDTGAKVIIREVRGDWRRVTIDGQTGWMFSTYLSPNTLE